MAISLAEKSLRMRPHFPFAELHYVQPLKQKGCFPAILSDGRDASPDLLHYGLLTP